MGRPLDFVLKRPPVAGCVLWMPGIDQPLVTPLRDRSGNNNNGTIIGATPTRLPSGLWGQSLDGGDDYLSIADAASLDASTTNAFSILLWIKPTSIAGDDAFVSHGAYNVDGYSLYAKGALGRFGIWAGAGEMNSDNAVLTLNSWQQMGVTFTNAVGSAILYYNGATIAQTAIAGWALNPTARTVYIGRDDTGTTFLGASIGLIRFCNRVLTASEIANIFRQERHLFGV